jgi:cell division protein FtsB
MDNLVLEPIIQYGFLGFSAVLLGVVIWLIQKLLALLAASNRVITANTEAIRNLTAQTCDLLRLTRSLHDKLLARPCIAEKERD